MRGVLALGANTGDRAANLHAALAALDALDGLDVEAVSSFVETAPVGAVPDQPDFLNAVALVRTTLDPHALLRACHAVEAAVGLDRARKVPDGPRPIDVDVVTLGDVVLDEDGLVLPHPRARERAFVLGPWLELDPDAELPGPRGGRVADLLARVAP
ncbi:2-amino-4-hydroxy-6-hydroxymethyldihydropteridine diphosphokinase [Kineococcus radiotolerans]|uniref:2-amino-4-hydroxy-6-hydroxymethyldihydropteridine diphosphokinase n=1 Tax=Kineococcus radiotolerans TaxID=131568 RepID=A0A7W4TKX1_KINRA|nr:2-amino-4-hydroxy-6-hydroxymethyldihydropteridine diphosphokinase [Kineococcus radiotolerans]MBB2900818.1 2-amino-4-hydroxy-6-hydroxymethyldihydropteridine diphosphokinase [Kineococcus radiotolerans]